MRGYLPLLLLLCTLNGSPANAASPTLDEPVLVGLMDLPPFFEQDASQLPLRPQGLLLPVIEALMKEAGLSYRVIIYPPQRLYRNMVSGQSHMTLKIATAPEIRDYVLPLDSPITTMKLNLYWRAQLPPPRARPAPEWWGGKPVCRMRGYSFAGMVYQLERLPTPPLWNVTRTRQQAVRLLAGQRCDYLLDYDLPLQQVLGPQLLPAMPPLAHMTLREVPWTVMVSANAPNAVALLDRLKGAQQRLLERNELQGLLPSTPAQESAPPAPAMPESSDLP